MNQLRHLGITFSLLLLGIGVMVCIFFYPLHNIESESVAISLDSQKQLLVRIYTPQNTATPQPVMLLCHGVNASKETMTPLAVELARHGIAAIAFDFGGFGESYELRHQEKSIERLEASTLGDAQAVVAFVRSHPERFDFNRIGIIGHSMGGTTALQLGQIDPNLRTIVVLGMSGVVTPTTPANLFLGIGLYEQLNSPQDLRAMLQQATGRENPNCINTKGDICGDFATGTARKLVISSTADHITEPYDPQLMRQVINWVQRALDLPVSQQLLVAPWFIFGLVITFSGSIASGVWVFFRTGKPVEPPKLRKFYGGFVTWLMGILMGVIWVMGTIGLSPSRGASNMLLLCYVLQLCSNYAVRYPKKVAKAVKMAGLYSFLLLGAFFLPAWLCGMVEILSMPEYFVSLPQFLLQWPFLIIYNYTQVVKLAFFPAYSLELSVSWLFWLLVFWELVLPGESLTILERVTIWGVKWLRRPFVFTGIGKISRQSAWLLGILIFVLVVILYQRLAEGLVSLVLSKGILALQQLGLFLLLPVVVIIVIARSRGFCRLESWLVRKE